MTWKEDPKKRHARNAARQRAMVRLSHRHQEEFDALVAEERQRGGPVAPRECERCQLPINEGSLCEFCEEWNEKEEVTI